MEIPEDALFYMCDITDITYAKYFRLISKSMKDYVNLKYKIYKMISFIKTHYSHENLKSMHKTGLIVHTNKLKSKIDIDKNSLLENLSLIKNEYLCTYLSQYLQNIQITTHSVILNLI